MNTCDDWKTRTPDDDDGRDPDPRCSGCGAPDPYECTCDDGSCVHVWRGVDDHDECDNCGAERPPTLREHIEENT